MLLVWCSRIVCLLVHIVTCKLCLQGTNVHFYTKGALAKDQANVRLHTKGLLARVQANVHLHTKGALAKDQANVHFHTRGQAKFHFHIKGAMELARGPVDVRPHSRGDLGWSHSHFSVGDFGLRSGHQLGAWWQQ